MNQIDLLRYDKVTRLEGICIEELFFRTFLAEDSFEISRGWWISKQKDDTFHFVHHTMDKPAKLDMEVAKKLALRNEVYFVKKINGQFRFYHYLSGSSTNDIMSGLNSGQTLPMKRSDLPDKIMDENDEYRKNKVLTYLDSIHADLPMILESRELANFYGSTMMWDIDFFVKYQNRLIAIEVKQKYPSKKESFGLNVGSYNVLKLLHECDFEVQHIILTKPERDKSHSAIEFLEGFNKSRAKWLGLRFNEKTFRSGIATSPKHTSYSQKKRLKYFSEKTSSFVEIGSLDDSGPESLKTYLEEN